jgi:formate dehydrogenase iron-sulfur subunit
MTRLAPPPAPSRTSRNTPAADPPRTLIDDLLAEQKQLQTPAARFSDLHARRLPDLADHYRSLIPLTKPGAGEQYAFEVALDRCTGCKACVSACHSLNGLDDDEAWRDTGVLLGGVEQTGWQQTITSACHHCADPGCLNGCPVGAYEKDSDTGIVRHLDDQCIGCSYCILKCPYDVPKYSKKRGIVRKCDMCHQRLAEGEAPACVQACPTEAIRIVTVSTAAQAPAHSPILADTTVTRPTTRYIGRELSASAHAADRDELLPQPTHWPLVLMLVLTQAGIGLLAAPQLTPSSRHELPLLLAGALLFNAGMAAATLHLGQPLKAWRFFLGLRTSWLSREILAFSLFAPIPLLLCVFPFLPEIAFLAPLLPITALSTLPLGLIAVFTSVMIYQDTRRTSWRFSLTATRFFGSVAAFASLGYLVANPSSIASLTFAACVFLKMIPEARVLQKAGKATIGWTPDSHSARLQLGPLRRNLLARFLFAFAATAVAPVQPWLAMPLLLVAEILERRLFFKAVHAPKMPGSFGPASRSHH